MKIEIQPRDIEILRFVFKFRVVTYDQIRRKFFASRHESASRNRIRALAKSGFVRTFPKEADGLFYKCVCLTKEAWPLIRESFPFEVQTPYFESESPEHDHRIAEIAMRFEKLSLYEDMVTENLFQSSEEFKSQPEFRDLVIIQSDGALKLKDSEGTEFLYSVELEASKKTPERYAEKLAAYYRAGGIDGVLYICASQEIRDVIARADRQTCTAASSIVYLALESDVLNASGKLIFRSPKGVSIGLY